jgi:hypothetical protein
MERLTAAYMGLSKTPRLALHSAFCDVCGSVILGTRYLCGRCDDFDVCSQCIPLLDAGGPHCHGSHPFVVLPTAAFRRQSRSVQRALQLIALSTSAVEGVEVHDLPKQYVGSHRYRVNGIVIL